MSPDPLDRPQFAQGDGGTWTVTSLADATADGCDDDCTLRDAIAAAASGDAIMFAEDLAGTIPMSAGALEIVDKSLSIDGDGRITIDAQADSRVLRIHDAVNSGTMAVVLTGLAIEGGAAYGSDEAAMQGGGIWVDGATVDLDLVTVSGSTAANGAGIALVDGEVRIYRSTISGNTASGGGGGILVLDGVLRIRSSTISGNQGFNSGGGLYVTGGLVAIARSTISSNVGRGGGGIMHSTSQLILDHTTVTANDALVGAQITAAHEGSITFSNSIIGGSGEAETACVYEANVLVLSGGHNLVSQGCAVPAPPATDIVLLDAQVHAQVLEAALADNGGPTRTHALFATGLGVDAGYCPSETADQRGLARPTDVAGTANAADGCDIGAYELQLEPEPLADLILSQAVDRISVRQGERLTYTVRVRNLGPQSAANVIVSNVLSSGVTFVEARPSKGTASAPLPGETGTVTWDVGGMESGDDEYAEIAVTVLVRGKTTITNVASVTADTEDPVAGNNSASITVSVGAGGSGGGSPGGGKPGGPKK